MSLVELENLTKRYGDVTAVNNASFKIKEGEIFGLVGPNGAGKTTLVEMVEGLRTPDEGKIKVLALDPFKDEERLKQRIGVLLQGTSLYHKIKVKEALRLFSSFYEKSGELEKVIQMFSLEEILGKGYKTLSGGQKQRLAIALALVNDPEILFLDELTTGLDPQSRRNMWEFVEKVREGGKTIFFITHYMEEAEKLCDRVAIMDYGRIIALDTPENLILSLGAEVKLSFIPDGEVNISELSGIKGVSKTEKLDEKVILYAQDESFALQELVRLSDSKRFKLLNLQTIRPNLDDVFITLTGRELRD